MNYFVSFKKYVLFFAAIMLLFTAPVCAQESTATSDGGGLEHQFSVGAAAFVMPKYDGSDSHRFMAFPLLEYRNQYFFISTMKGAGINVLRTPTMTAGPLVAYRFGRKESVSSSLDGLGNVKGGAEAGAFFNWQFHERLGTGIKALHGLGNAKGFIADVGLTYNQSLMDDLAFTLQVSTRFADSEYNKQFFGITDEQSRRSGYDRYNPGSGIKHVSIKPALHYTFLEDYTVGVFYEYKRLTGPAADSPLVKKGSADQSTMGVSLAWTF